MNEKDGDPDLDARFEAIIAHWDEDAGAGDPDPGPPTRGSAADSATPDAATPDDGDEATPPQGPGPGTVAPMVNAPWPVWRGPTGGSPSPLDPDVQSEDDPDEHFEPGPLAPLPPQEDLHFWGIVVGLTVGPLLLLWLVIARPDVSRWWTWLAVSLSVGGFVLLVLRQPRHRDDDDPDNGARV